MARLSLRQLALRAEEEEDYVLKEKGAGLSTYPLPAYELLLALVLGN